MKMLKGFFVYVLFHLIIVPLLIISQSHAIMNEKTPVASNKEHKTIDKLTKARVQEAYDKLPLYFIKNNGQADTKVKFYEKGQGHNTYFTKEGVYLALTNSQKNKANELKSTSEIIRLTPINANKKPEIIAEGLERSRANYFMGNDPKDWKTNIPAYKAVVYKEIYKNIDILFYGNNRQLEYDIIIKPGGNAADIRFLYDGIEGLKITDEGNLEISLKEGKIIQKRPYIYQEIEGRKVMVEGTFAIYDHENIADVKNSSGKQFAYNFILSSYDKNHALIIDPVIVYSTYLGGSSLEYMMDANIGDIAVDNSGNVYITGQTQSIDFPTASPLQAALAGSADVFVVKIDASGSSLVYSTYLGGNNADNGTSIAVDANGNAYIAGMTYSSDFPTASPMQSALAGGCDVFVTKINALGNALIYSTYLGGSDLDFGYAIAIDANGNAYIAGGTASTDFPVINAFQAAHAGGWFDAFAAKVNSSGSSLAYSTYLGGSGYDLGNGIAVDATKNAYISGRTASYDFPTAFAIYGTFGGGNFDAFAAKVNSSGSSLVYSTYLGGSGDDAAWDIAVDSSKNAYITGHTFSIDFPTVSPTQAALAGGSDAFVTKINAPGNSLLYSTYLGGNGGDVGRGVTADYFGNAYVTGSTGSTNFPTLFPIQGANAGWYDIFATKINASGSNLMYSTYLGGSVTEWGHRIAVDSFGSAYITGETWSIDFPTVNPVQGAPAGSSEAFVTKIGESGVVHVQIDIKPKSPLNKINPNSTDIIPVAILTSGDFDAATVDPLSVRFGPKEAVEVHNNGHIRNVDGDGDLDLLLHFNIQDTGIQCGETFAILTGMTFDGQKIIGFDKIKTVQCN